MPMRNYFKYILLAISLLIIGMTLFFGLDDQRQLNIDEDIYPIAENENILPSEELPPEAKPETVNNNLTPPINRIDERVWINEFGGRPSEATIDPQYSDLICPKGILYEEYHTGVDAETSKDELDTPVSVRSMADGVVRQDGFVSGYGGLIVIEHTINGNVYTAYYGHVDQSTFKVSAGSTVKNGQIIANLAPACTDGNGNTRKHLHLGVHKGKEIVVAGYVLNKSELDNWIDPRSLF